MTDSSSSAARKARRSVPTIAAITAGAPFDRLSRSGTSHHLFTNLQRSGSLVDVVNARPGRIELLEKLGAVRASPGVRQQRLDTSSTSTSPLARSLMTALAWTRMMRGTRSPDALLQIGAWYDPVGLGGLRPRMRCSYHDGNLAVYLRRPDLSIDAESRLVRRSWRFEQRLYDKMDLIMPRSEWLRKSFIEDFNQDPDKVVAIGAGVNFDGLPEVRDRDWSVPRLLFVGKDFQRKGGPELLAAFAGLRARRPDAELWVVGPRDPIPSQRGVRQIPEIRRDTPEGDAEIHRLYREATAFVMPSRFEPWGNAFLEAMAYRLPCVGADCCAMPELIENGVSGLLVPPGDAEGLERALEELTADPDRARRMGEAGFVSLQARYTWPQVVARMVEQIAVRLERSACDRLDQPHMPR